MYVYIYIERERDVYDVTYKAQHAVLCNISVQSWRRKSEYAVGKLGVGPRQILHMDQGRFAPSDQMFSIALYWPIGFVDLFSLLLWLTASPLYQGWNVGRIKRHLPATRQAEADPWIKGGNRMGKNIGRYINRNLKRSKRDRRSVGKCWKLCSCV